MKVDNSAQIRNRIEELKRGKHAVILVQSGGSRLFVVLRGKIGDLFKEIGRASCRERV